MKEGKVMNKADISGIPLVVDPYQDLTPRNDLHHRGADSWFLVVYAKLEDGSLYNFLIHCLTRGKNDDRVTLCISDITHKRYISQITARCTIEGIDDGVRMDAEEVKWTIKKQSMNVKANWGKGKQTIDLTISGDGTVFGYNSNGQLPLFGKEGQNIQYAFPNLTVQGHFTEEGVTMSLTGEAWLDRQWGPLPFEDFLVGNANWLWIAGKLDDKSTIAIWSSIKSGVTYNWITILSTHGIYTVAPLASSVIDSGKELWISKKSGMLWASCWEASCPALSMDLHFRMTHTGQEIYSATDRLPIPSCEASIEISGTMEGRKTHGHGFVELIH